MLISEKLLCSLLEHLKISDWFASVPYSWSKSQQSLELKCEGKLRIYRFRVFAAAMHTFTIFIQISWTWGEAERFVKLYTVLNFVSLLMVVYTHYVVCFRAKEIVCYINGMICFEGRRNERLWIPEKRMYRKMTKLILRLSEMTGLVLPLLYHADMMMNPCMPMHLGGYWLVTEQCRGEISTKNESTWTKVEIAKKLALFAISYVTWNFLMNGFLFHLSIGLLLKSHCLRNYTLLLVHSLRTSPTVATYLSYREIQVLSVVYRGIYSKYMTAVVLISFMVIHTVSLYTCIQLGLGLPLPLLVMFGMLSVDCPIVTMFMYTSLANVFKTSRQFLEEERRQLQSKKGKRFPLLWFRKFLKSCQVVKVFVGDINFVEELTPLTVEDFVARQTGGLLLLE